MNLVSSDDVVLQRPEDLHFRLPVFHTDVACPGAVTSYLLRRVAYRAGAYAPGIQESLFHELNSGRHGGSLENVQQWFSERVYDLHALGYRLHCRRANNRTATISDWVAAAPGYRGAMLPTAYGKLHPGRDTTVEISHAIGLTVERVDASSNEELVMIDAFPASRDAAGDRTAVPRTLEAAHRECNYHALIFYWSGWS
jgi:hypothetical protein